MGDSRSVAGMTALYTFCPYAFQVLLRQRRVKRDHLRDHFRADKQAAVGCNLSCESIAFQGKEV